MKKFNDFLRGNHGANGSIVASIGSLMVTIIPGKDYPLLFWPIAFFVYYVIIIVATGFAGDDN